MDYDKFIDTKEIEIEGKRFATSLIPALSAQGIYGDIVRATTDVGDIGMTFLPISVAKKLLSYAAYYNPGNGMWTPFHSEDDINREFPSVTALIEFECAMIRRNFGFLFDGSLRKVLEELRGTVSARKGPIPWWHRSFTMAVPPCRKCARYIRSKICIDFGNLIMFRCITPGMQRKGKKKKRVSETLLNS